ncbi:YybH family protein [Spongiimicrobium sp. 3-5]|uniref:YybH family protein n=1 Tax=Spongiimicrobium sp. 3-5 TaxID=3332596 RepID=UPI00397F33DC
MKKIIVGILIALTYTSCGFTEKANPEKDKEAIVKVLEDQEKAWNNYDLEGFMQTYWKSNALKFFSSGGVTSGWDQTLANYHKRYPSKDHVGTLSFTLKDISPIDGEAYFVMGDYHLARKIGDADGIFMVIFKKINGEWKIIADLSCSS